MSEINLWTLFEAMAGALGERPAIIYRGRTETFAQLFERSVRLANVLASHKLGVRAERDTLRGWECGQDTVGLYLLNSPEYLEANLAGYAARTAPFNVNYRYVADELAYLLDDAGTAALVYHARFAPTLTEVLPRLARRPVLLQVADDSGNGLLDGAVDYEQALASAPAEPPRLDHRPEDLYVLYTGGTTGMPKGTLWRQADIWKAAIGADKGDTPVDTLVAEAVAKEPIRFLPNAPLMHGAAQWLALHQLLGGDVVVVNSVNDHLDARDICTTIERERINAMLLVGEAFARPVLAEMERGDYDMSSMVLIATGGAVMSPETKTRILSVLPNIFILDAAGSSESGSGLSQISAGSATPEAGIFDPSPEVAVLDAGRQRVVEPGEDHIGWFAKFGSIPLGYLGDEAKTAGTFPVVGGVRWSVPGDRARRRADGKVELLGRDSVTINSAGEKIFVEEVEAAAMAHPAVADAVVVGRPSQRFGEAVVAVVALSEGAEISDEALRDAMGARLARYKLPRSVIRVPEIVRSPAGKADYRWARQVAVDDADPADRPVAPVAQTP